MSEDEKEIKKYHLPIKIKLSKPIDTGDGEISELVISREPTGADWSTFNISNSTIADFQRLAARLCNVPLPIIKKIDTTATFELVNAINDFLV